MPPIGRQYEPACKKRSEKIPIELVILKIHIFVLFGGLFYRHPEGRRLKAHCRALYIIRQGSMPLARLDDNISGWVMEGRIGKEEWGVEFW